MLGCSTRSATACKIVVLGLFGLVISSTGFSASGQTVAPEIRDHSDSLDVPFVPSHTNVLQAMYDMAKPTKDDFLIDLGSGDGRIVIGAAHRFGTHGYGVDLNEGLVNIATERAQRAGVASKVRFEVRDLYKTDLSRATILTMYLLPDIVQELRPTLLRVLRPGTRIVSHDYHMADWRPDDIRIVDISPAPNDPEQSIIYFWVVPAEVTGNWSWIVDYPNLINHPLEYSAQLKQVFQDFEGTVEAMGIVGRVHRAAVTGTQIAFSADLEVDEAIVRHEFSGVVKDNTISGTVRLSGGIRPVTLPWNATRTRIVD